MGKWGNNMEELGNPLKVLKNLVLGTPGTHIFF